VTTLAQGIPMGGEIDNMDQTTISYSFSNRRSF
jgi:recombinational DNA repair protein RecR